MRRVEGLLDALVGAERRPGVGAGVVEVDVERQLVVGLGVSLAKLALDGPVAGADMVLYDVGDDSPHILDLRQLRRRPVMQELGALVDNGAQVARKAVVGARVERTVIEPETVEGAA